MNQRPTKVPESLPRCELINILASKADARHDIEFNFIAHLDTFHQTIRAIVGQISLLFPEYTPHDDQYHLRNLFHVADTILGNQQLQSMNSAELFILACSLYGHDWGMAVSNSEKHYILTGRGPDGMTQETLLSLKWDRESFCLFASKCYPPLHDIDKLEDLPLPIWQEYVRQTHARRSAERAREHFRRMDSGVAEAVMRVCQSHSLNFEELRDPLYPTAFSVLREEVNLRALSLYLRLIDLFDLAQDRTPYVLWKFVAPRSPLSSLEWAKHRSLQPITCPTYLEGRCIRVDGSTADHEVFAALEDLRQYCELELKGCNDVLSRMNDPRHKLGLYSIDWHVAPIGFTPVSIRFDFDRQSMFDILTDQIYQGDCYVFLRELLQNSIDAIRFRRAVLQRKGISPAGLGVIRFTVENQHNGYIIVTCTDDGIGMDEYIVRNYLAVVGKSYYQSSDFKRQGIDMDPISRFGIGILSCFMVADLVEIETYKDPYAPPTGSPLRIRIPSLNRQFRTEILTAENAQPGTTVRVYVDPNKIASRFHEARAAPFLVTPYLCAIAGFVEYPILIEENNKKTVILNPYQDTSEAKRRFGKEYETSSISLRYPWDELFVPQDISVARATLREESYDLRTDLKLDDCEGSLIYLVPFDDSTDFSPGGLYYDVKVLSCRDHGLKGAGLRWHGHWLDSAPTPRQRLAPSGLHSHVFAMYRDGILVPRADPPHTSTMETTRDARHPTHGRRYPIYQFSRSILLVNLTRSQLPNIDLSRTAIVGDRNLWAESIFQAHLHYILAKHSEELIHLEPADRLLKLVRLALFYNIDPEAIGQHFPKEYLPMPLLQHSGQISFTTWEDLLHKSISLPPELITEELADIADNVFRTHERYHGFLNRWVGEPCLAVFNEDKPRSISVRSIRGFFRLLLDASHHFTSIRFLNPPWEGNPPLLQFVYDPIQIPEYDSEELNTLLDKAAKSIRSLGQTERILLNRHLQVFNFPCPRIATFTEPFKQHYAYADVLLNMEHDAAELLLRILSKISLSARLKELSPQTLGQLLDAARNAMSSMPGRFESSQEHYSSWTSSLRILGETANRSGISSEDPAALIPRFSEFIPGSLSNLGIRLQFTRDIREFGQVL